MSGTISPFDTFCGVHVSELFQAERKKYPSLDVPGILFRFPELYCPTDMDLLEIEPVMTTAPRIKRSSKEILGLTAKIIPFIPLIRSHDVEEFERRFDQDVYNRFQIQMIFRLSILNSSLPCVKKMDEMHLLEHFKKKFLLRIIHEEGPLSNDIEEVKKIRTFIKSLCE